VKRSAKCCSADQSHFAALMESRYLALSFEIEELHPTLNYKQNNVHALFK
jgi:5-carboxymethyl-2-hydroxymuconate isomerase